MVRFRCECQGFHRFCACARLLLDEFDDLLPFLEFARCGGVHPLDDWSELCRQGLGELAGEGKPEPAIVAAVQQRAHGSRSMDDSRVDLAQGLHVNGERFRRGAIGLTDPSCLPVVVDRHQRAVADRGVAGERPSREFPGREAAFEDAGVRAGLGENCADEIAARGAHLEREFVMGVAEVAVVVDDTQVDRVAGFDLAGGAHDRFALVRSRPPPPPRGRVRRTGLAPPHFRYGRWPC